MSTPFISADGRSFTYRVRNGGYVLTCDWPFLIEEGTLTVPCGFRTDLASIPRLLWVIPGLCHNEVGVNGPVFHDACYRGIIGRGPDIILRRRRVDRIFWRLLRADGVGRIRAGTVWAAVRVFGGWAWCRLPTLEQAVRLAD